MYTLAIVTFKPNLYVLESAPTPQPLESQQAF